MSRLEEIINDYKNAFPVDIEWLIGQAKVKKEAMESLKLYMEENHDLNRRVEELEKERSDWKGKHSILKRKYKGLQQKMNARWRYNRAVENDSRANKAVLEEFRGQNKRYKQALEFYADENSYEEFYDLMRNRRVKMILEDGGRKAREAVEESE